MTDVQTGTSREVQAVWQFTARSGELAAALRNVAAFSGSDDTLPVLTGVHMRVTGSTVTLTATDRYCLARQTVTLEAPAAMTDPASPAELMLMPPVVKVLTAVKARDGKLPVVLQLASDGTLEVRTYDATFSYPHVDYVGQFPRCDKFYEGFVPALEDDRPGNVAFNPKFLARFAKLSGDPQQGVRFEFPKGTRQGGDPGMPVRWTFGEVTGFLCSIRKPE
jgi:hypothetical protein